MTDAQISAALEPYGWEVQPLRRQRAGGEVCSGPQLRAYKFSKPGVGYVTAALSVETMRFIETEPERWASEMAALFALRGKPLGESPTSPPEPWHD